MIYDVSCKTLTGTKPLQILFDREDEFIRDYGRTNFFFKFFLFFFKNYIQNETLIQVIKITKYIQINI